MTTTRVQPETIAFLDYLDEHVATSHLGDKIAELLVRLGKLAPVPVRVDDDTPQRRAS